MKRIIYNLETVKSAFRQWFCSCKWQEPKIGFEHNQNEAAIVWGAEKYEGHKWSNNIRDCTNMILPDLIVASKKERPLTKGSCIVIQAFAPIANAWICERESCMVSHIIFEKDESIDTTHFTYIIILLCIHNQHKTHPFDSRLY